MGAASQPVARRTHVVVKAGRATRCSRRRGSGRITEGQFSSGHPAHQLSRSAIQGSRDDRVVKMQTNSVPCRICGSLKRAHGHVDDARFRVKIPFAKFVVSDCVMMNAVACLDCGHVELQVDPDQIKTLLGEGPR